MSYVRSWLVFTALTYGLVGAHSEGVGDEAIQEGTFGNWSIHYLTINKTFNLVGFSSRPTRGYFTFQCHPTGGYTLSISLTGLTKKAGATVKLNLWSDHHEPINLEFPIWRGIAAIAMTTNPESNEQISQFVEVLGSSQSYFALSYEDVTEEFDARYLPAARSRFFTLCKSGRPP